jgi:hypothetical protein
MGNETSKPQLYARISKALPPLAPQYGINENIDWVDKGTKAFASEGDREQFICTSEIHIQTNRQSFPKTRHNQAWKYQNEKREKKLKKKTNKPT